MGSCVSSRRAMGVRSRIVDSPRMAERTGSAAGMVGAPPVFGGIKKGGAARIRSADHLRWLAMYQARRMTPADIVREERRRFDERAMTDAALDQLKGEARDLSPARIRSVI